jgi:hypothetical protein
MWCGFPFARVGLSKPGETFAPSEWISLHVGHTPVQDGMPELRPILFAEVIAFLASLPRAFRAAKVFTLNGVDYPFWTEVFCTKCEHRMFRVRFTLPELHFHISVIESCECRGRIWSGYHREHERSHWYYRVCDRQWAVIDAKLPLPKSQPLARIAKFALNHSPTLSVPAADGLRAIGYSNAWLANLAKVRQGQVSLEEFARRLKGFCHMRVDLTQAASRYTYEGHHVVSFCWIACWALEAFAIAQFIELDCSWKAVKFYAYCIPLAIINNEAIPLGFIITPTEAQETYEWFFDDLEHAAGAPLAPKTILSDEHAALKGFADLRGWPHVFCYYHLINKFKDDPVLQLMAARILRLPELELFDAELPAVLLQLDLLHDRHLINDAAATKFAIFLGFPAYPVDPTWRHEFRHGIWDRDDFVDPANTAHDERIHRTAENRTAEVADYVQQFDQIVALITKKYDDFQNGKHPQRKRILNELKAQRAEPKDVCDAPSCRRRRELWAHRFGLGYFPCKHTVHSPTDISPPDVPTVRLQGDPSTFAPLAVLVTPTPSWAFATEKPASAAMTVSQFEPVRQLPQTENEFLIRVMRETAKLRRIDNKKDLMLDICIAWRTSTPNTCEDERNDPRVRAEFWFTQLFPNETK